MGPDQIHVFIGTKAQYIKTAPLLRLMDAREVPYRLIDSGQHAALSTMLRSELGVRDPDVTLGGSTDVSTITEAIRWAATIGLRLWSGRRIRDEIFGGRRGICVVHGDTPSTLLSAAMAWRAGLRVAHMEAGLRSNSLLHPFPEELIRIIVMRLADVTFAPTPDAVSNLESIRRRGRIIPLEGNTSIEAVAYALDRAAEAPTGPAIVTMHRVENLSSRERVGQFVDTVTKLAGDMPVKAVLHEPTRIALERFGLLSRLEERVETTPLSGHTEFLQDLLHAPLVIIDGGSIQEECSYLGVPTLLWREKTERLHGLGSNIVLSEFDQRIINDFLSRYEEFRRPPSLPATRPSEQILEVLLAELSGQASVDS